MNNKDEQVRREHQEMLEMLKRLLYNRIHDEEVTIMETVDDLIACRDLIHRVEARKGHA